MPEIAIIFAVASDGIAAIKMWNFSALAFPIYLVIINISIALAIYRRKIFRKVDGFVIETESGFQVFKEMHDLLETFPNRKIISTGANNEQYNKFCLDKMPYKDLVALKSFLTENLG